MEERIQKIISASGAASRREAERLISEGRVTVNGVIAELGKKASVDDAIKIDGVSIVSQEQRCYIMLYKPRGYVTTMSDEKGRRTVRELTENVGQRVYPVGRLDLDSEGLLIMTSDGDFANKVMHPSYEKTKEYFVTVSGALDIGISGMSEQMDIDGYMIRPASVKVLKRDNDRAVLSVTIHEGRNRQIRRMCELCGLKVHRLKRVAVGAVRLGNLKPGQWRHLTTEEITVLAHSDAE